MNDANDAPKKKVDKNEVNNQSTQATTNYPAGCLRGVVLSLGALFLSIMIGIASGQSVGTLWGIIIGTVTLIVFIVVISFVVNRSKKLTIVDCVLPFIISVIAAVAFAPVALFSGNLFSIATCIFSGVLMSVGLILFKLGKIHGAFLVLPMLTFIYEILPIDLPSDLDNILAFSVTTINLVVGRYLGPTKQVNQVTQTNEVEQIEDRQVQNDTCG